MDHNINSLQEEPIQYVIVFTSFDGATSELLLSDVIPNYKNHSKNDWPHLVHEKLHDHPIHDDSICMEIKQRNIK